jgi:nucleotide-binding universal stress UspA family protein
MNTNHAPIVVGIRDPEREDTLMSYAVAAALAEGRDLRLVHAVHPIVGAGGPGAMVVDYDIAQQIADEIIRRAVSRVRHLLEQAGAPETVHVVGVTLRGSAVDALVQEGRDADRVVLMRRQLARLHRIATGSVSNGVAARSSVPVVIVPEAWTPSSTAVGPGSFRVVVGLHGGGHRDQYDEGLVEQGFAQAVRHDGTLGFLHAWYLPSMYDDAIVDRTSRNEWSEREGRRIQAALEPWTRRHQSVPTDVQVVHLPAGDALVEASRHASLLLLGRHGPGRPFPHLGSVTRAVLREAHCPVEIVPAEVAAEPENLPVNNVTAAAS